jgi:hypothetical protein
MNDPLALAKEFIANGVPVFIAKKFPLNMSSRAEYDYPEDWQTLEPDEKHLEGWKPLYAVCAVTGIQFDVLDIDPRNDGHLVEKVLRSNGMMPPTYGTVTTPRGGRHYYIHRTGLRKYTPWNGVDLQAGNSGGYGRGFVFIPPTRRRGRHYEVTQGLNWHALGSPDDSPERAKFCTALFRTYDFNKSEEHRMDTGRYVLDWDEVDREDLRNRIQEIGWNIANAEVGTRDTALNKYCFTVGGLVAGSALDEEFAVKLLQKATADWDITQNERDTWVTPKILRGIEQGKLYPILCGF